MVVAHYKEKLAPLKWIREYPHIVYDRADNITTEFNATWQENIGREGYVYLKHIIDNYNQLANMTVFLQADACNSPHHVHSASFRSNVVGLASGNITLPKEIDGFAFLAARNNCMSLLWPYDYTKKLHNLFVNEFRDQLNFPVPKPRFMSQGLFAVTKEVIHRNPVQYYVALLNKLGKENNPRYGYFLEAAWPEIFHSTCGAHPVEYYCFPGPPQKC